MQFMTIPEIKRAAQEGRVEATLHAQVESLVSKQTRDGKPYWELTMADAEGKLMLRAWSDSPNFEFCAGLTAGTFLEIDAEFSLHPAFGVEARFWEGRPLEPEQVEQLLGGPPALREKQAADYAAIEQLVGSILDPRLRGVSELFLSDLGERFRRTAGARTYHHARRGGLVEHVAQMMRTADRLCEVYPSLNRDLLLAGTLLHDAGKLWENCMEAHGFTMPYDERGELMGHIPIGIELLNTLWRKLLASEAAFAWSALEPTHEETRLHLIHLIASHHGEMQFGSPVFPKTPEAAALHYIDNLDAKMEMFARGYQTGVPLAERIVERVRPLPANLVWPLAPFSPPPDPV
jgi:3'-5' exoribonuclease